MHPSVVVEHLEKFDKVKRPPDDVIKKMIEKPLLCNTCSYVPKHMPDLKKHLLTHLQLYKGKV